MASIRKYIDSLPEVITNDDLRNIFLQIINNNWDNSLKRDDVDDIIYLCDKVKNFSVHYYMFFEMVNFRKKIAYQFKNFIALENKMKEIFDNLSIEDKALFLNKLLINSKINSNNIEPEYIVFFKEKFLKQVAPNILQRDLVQIYMQKMIPEVLHSIILSKTIKPLAYLYNNFIEMKKFSEFKVKLINTEVEQVNKLLKEAKEKHSDEFIYNENKFNLKAIRYFLDYKEGNLEETYRPNLSNSYC